MRLPDEEEPVAFDLSRPRALYLVGLGGAGMSAIATVLVEMGHRVSGSDLKDGPALDRLRGLGVEVFIGHDARQLGEVEAVAISSAISAANPEVRGALERGLPLLSRADLLGAVTRLRRTAAVSGTHGKTTTTSMLSLILLEAGFAPSFLIGGEVNEIGTSATWGSGEWLVVEADESDGTFLRLGAELALVTNVDADHLDHYGTLGTLEAAFSRFLSQAHRAVICIDDPAARRLAPRGALTYGVAADAEFRIVGLSGGRSEIAFELWRGDAYLERFHLPVPGVHNAQNAAGALAAAAALGIPMDAARRALARFTGVARRFAFRGEAAGVTFVDDYAHHPTEVAATLAAARRGEFGRVVAVFQPHRFTRVQALAPEFADAFALADLVVVTSIYAAGEPAIPGVTGARVLDAVRAAHPELPAVYLPQRADVVAYLVAHLQAGDCCLTMSAGDLTTLPDELLNVLGSAG